MTSIRVKDENFSIHQKNPKCVFERKRDKYMDRNRE